MVTLRHNIVFLYPDSDQQAIMQYGGSWLPLDGEVGVLKISLIALDHWYANGLLEVFTEFIGEFFL